ncbi:DUF1871 family protein [Mesobacillus harenae]|uniref:DUF1871 family protein n=1 Tax=Mesobacillus harenae TaxID=2213203 RepID=UPI001580441A|nr:DUF1871 family protein [Mesobacillus harenae]
MDIQEINIKMVRILDKWDPFDFGEGNYAPEVADVIQAVHDLDDTGQIAVRIQAIYEFSFEKTIALKECLEIAMQLAAVKDQGACSI